MVIVKVYRMTIASIWYDEDAEKVKEFEMHYKIARTGPLRENRQHLAKRCVPHFQQNISTANSNDGYQKRNCDYLLKESK